MSDLLILLENRGFSPRKTSTNHGGEFCSPCPVCGDGGKGAESNRFHVWPYRESSGKGAGRFWCRQCGLSGDTIAFLQKVDGMTFQSACAELGIPLDHPVALHNSRYASTPVPPRSNSLWAPKTYTDPSPLWMDKASALLADCQSRLLATPEAMAWLSQRGISADVARTYSLGYNLSSQGKDRYRPRESWGLPEKHHGNKAKRLWIPRGWVIAAFNPAKNLIQLRVRRLDEDVQAFASNIKYLPLDGSSMATMVLHPEAEVFVVVECGFDAILLAGLLGGKVGAITTWNSAARPDVYAHNLLSRSSLILGALDYDAAGDGEQAWWGKQYRQYRRLAALPGSAKDPGDAAKAGVDLKSWIVAGLPRGLQIKLGLASGARKQAPPQSQPAPLPAESAAQNEPPPVFELELTGGKVVYVTNDPDQWDLLAAQGKPVFSQNELERLQSSLPGLDPEERATAIMRAIESKEVFGGYILRGRQPQAV